MTNIINLSFRTFIPKSHALNYFNLQEQLTVLLKSIQYIHLSLIITSRLLINKVYKRGYNGK